MLFPNLTINNALRSIFIRFLQNAITSIYAMYDLELVILNVLEARVPILEKENDDMVFVLSILISEGLSEFNQDPTEQNPYEL